MFQVLYIQAFVFVVLMWKLMRKMFFGQLRAAEMEVRDLKVIECVVLYYSNLEKAVRELAVSFGFR